MDIATANDPMTELTGLPGEELIRQGLKDIKVGTESIPALLVAVGHPRLRQFGPFRDVTNRLWDDPEVRLYRLVAEQHPHEAHSQYNALIRRLISFERAYEHRKCRGRRQGEN